MNAGIQEQVAMVDAKAMICIYYVSESDAGQSLLGDGGDDKGHGCLASFTLLAKSKDGRQERRVA